MSKRFQTYFGVPIPPKKRQKIGAGSFTIRFVIKGKIPSKKNNASSIAVRSPAISFLKKKGATVSIRDAIKAVNMVNSKMVGNKEYKEFLKRYKPIIQEQAQFWSEQLQHKGLIFPLTKCTISVSLYFSNRYRTDSVNKEQTIQDLLVESGIISDDNYNVLNPIYIEGDCYADEITDSIAFISISFKPDLMS